VEVNVPKVETTNNVILCIDKSGSMSGSPIKNVCEVLRDIYNRTQVAYPLFCYDTVVTKTTLSDILNKDINASGGTLFSAIFDAIYDHMLKNLKPTTFIFMTDGDDQGDKQTLNKSIEKLKLLMSGIKHIPITIHTIGFGLSVKDDFLNQVRKFGTKEGLFKYSKTSVDLQSSFNDMFEYALSSRDVTIKIDKKSYTSSSNDQIASFLVDDIPIELNFLTLKTDVEVRVELKQLENVRSIHLLRALNLISPENEDEVKNIISQLNSILPTGIDKMEKLDVEQIKKEISDRMMEYINLFTQIKMGQVPEEVKLKLSALRHDAKFANVKRENKLKLRIHKNVEYFKKTDIKGILEGYKKSISPEEWDVIKQSRNDWICSYSFDNIYEIMRKSPDNILCLGILVERNETAIDSPTKGLKLLSVSNTIISYDSFIEAMTLAKKTNTDSYGNFTDINDEFCIVGESREKINAVIPLYINYEHMKRIRILEGIWLGHLFTLDSYGYDQNQEIGLLKLLYDVIIANTGTTRNKSIIEEFGKMCKFLIDSAVKNAKGETIFDSFISSIPHRTEINDLYVLLVIGYLNKDINSTAIKVYHYYMKQQLSRTITDTDSIRVVDRLMYGLENTTVSTTVDKTFSYDGNDPDYVEKSFVEYFDDEMNKPIQLIPEIFVGKTRRAIIDTEVTYIKSIIPAVPDFIKGMLKYANLNLDLENELNYDDIRKELLLILFFDSVPPHVNKSNVCEIIDEKIQGSKDDTIKFDLSPENVDVVVYKITTSKTLKGFGGLMRKYCPKRCGVIFDIVVKNLVTVGGAVLAREKIVALLTNRISNTPLYYNLDSFCWQPLINMDYIRGIVGDAELNEIERTNIGKNVVRCYRLSNKLNYHGFGNHNPFMQEPYKFIGYNMKYYTNSQKVI